MGRTIAISFALFCVCGLLVGMSLLPKPSVVTEHHVSILAQLDNGDYAYKSDEEPNGGTYRPCVGDKEFGVDVDAILSQGVGYIADYAVWQEQGVCKSILKPEWGFWFKDAANNYQYERITKNGTQRATE